MGKKWLPCGPRQNVVDIMTGTAWVKLCIVWKCPTYFIDHVCQETLDLVVVELFLAAEADGSSKFGDGNSGATDWWRASLLRLFESAGEVHLAA